MINKILEIFFALFIITSLIIGSAYSIRFLCHLFRDKTGENNE